MCINICASAKKKKKKSFPRRRSKPCQSPWLIPNRPCSRSVCVCTHTHTHKLTWGNRTILCAQSALKKQQLTLGNRQIPCAPGIRTCIGGAPNPTLNQQSYILPRRRSKPCPSPWNFEERASSARFQIDCALGRVCVILSNVSADMWRFLFGAFVTVRAKRDG